MKRLSPLLAAIAGMVDITGYLTMGHVFTAHVTGNLVLIAADVARDTPLRVTQVAILPTFMFAVAAAWGVVRVASRKGASPILAILWIQLVLLALVPVVGNELGALVATTAMGFQFAMLRLTMPGTPSTGVMTGNVVNSVISLLDSLNKEGVAREASREKLRHATAVLAGFFGGCVIAGLSVKVIGHATWLLPITLSAYALFEGRSRPT